MTEIFMKKLLELAGIAFFLRDLPRKTRLGCKKKFRLFTPDTILTTFVSEHCWKKHMLNYMETTLRYPEAQRLKVSRI